MRRWAAGVLAAVVAVMTATPAHASSGVDLAVTAKPVTGHVGQTVGIRWVQHNYGTAFAHTGDGYLETQLPGGTEFASAPGSSCTVIVPKRHIRCPSQVEIPPDSQRNGGPGGFDVLLFVVVKSAPTTPGYLKIYNPHDTNHANDRTSLIVNVPGYPTPGTTKAVPGQPSATTVRTEATPPTTMPSNPATTMTSDPATPAASSADPAPSSVEPLATKAAESAMPWGLFAVGVPLAAALGGSVVFMRRRRRTGASEIDVTS